MVTAQIGSFSQNWFFPNGHFRARIICLSPPKPNACRSYSVRFLKKCFLNQNWLQQQFQFQQKFRLKIENWTQFVGRVICARFLCVSERSVWEEEWLKDVCSVEEDSSQWVMEEMMGELFHIDLSWRWYRRSPPMQICHIKDWILWFQRRISLFQKDSCRKSFIHICNWTIYFKMR